MATLIKTNGNKNKVKPSSSNGGKNRLAELSKGKAAAASAKAKATVVVTANPRLVAALKNYYTSKSQTQSYLVDMATIVQEEQLTKNEIVASMIEARGIEKVSAESQYSRIKGILHSADTLEKLQSGEWDLKTARAATVNGQRNPNQGRKAENAEKRLSKNLQAYIIAVKELGMDFQSSVNQVKVALKKAGVK